jgi:hypothetical protein
MAKKRFADLNRLGYHSTPAWATHALCGERAVCGRALRARLWRRRCDGRGLANSGQIQFAVQISSTAATSLMRLLLGQMRVQVLPADILKANDHET